MGKTRAAVLGPVCLVWVLTLVALPPAEASPGGQTVTITLAKAALPAGGAAEGKAKVEIEEAFRGRIAVMWEDSHGRILERTTSEARFPSRQEMAFKFALDKFPMTLVNKIVLVVTDADNLVRKARVEATFTITPLPFVWDDFQVLLWGSRIEGATQDYINTLKAGGITAGMVYSHRSPTMWDPTDWLVDHNLRFYVENVRQIGWDNKIFRQLRTILAQYEETRDKRLLERDPCMNNPNYWASSKAKIQGEVRGRKMYRPIAYNIGDEQSVGSFTRPSDFCFGPYCMDEFHAYLRSKYKTLANLNAEWATEFSSWDHVLPLTREEVRERGNSNYAPWADHRTFMETTMADLIERFIGYFHEIEPEAHIGVEGTQKPGAYGGFDYWKLMNTKMGFLEPYDIGGSREIVRSFNKRCNVVGLAGPRAGRTRSLWNMLLTGLKGTIIWRLKSFTRRDDSLTDGALAIKDTLNELTGGIAKLIPPETRQHDCIAIHYSQPSIHGKWIRMKNIPMYFDHEILTEHDFERLAFMRLVEDLGYQYSFVSYEQVEKGGLTDYKVLLMPTSIALSPQEAAEIEKFVRSGGMVIADYQAGWMRDNCRMLEKPLLDDLFGIARESHQEEDFDIQPLRYSRNGYWSEKMPELGDKHIVLDKAIKGVNFVGARMGYPVVESAIRPTNATALAQGDGVPALIMNKVGKGQAILLNFRLLYYLGHRAKHTSSDDARQMLDLFRALLKLANVEPEVELSAPIDTELVRFKEGGAHYLAVIRNPQARQGGLGEVIQEKSVTGGAVAISLKLNQPRHVYESRSATYLGHTDTASGTLDSAAPLIFSALPYRVSALEIDAQETCAHGKRFQANIRLVAEGKPEWAKHVFRVRLHGPDGKERYDCKQNLVARNGQATYYYDTALNDLTGRWRLTVRDVATGLESSHRFMLVGGGFD